MLGRAGVPSILAGLEPWNNVFCVSTVHKIGRIEAVDDTGISLFRSVRRHPHGPGGAFHGSLVFLGNRGIHVLRCSDSIEQETVSPSEAGKVAENHQRGRECRISDRVV